MKACQCKERWKPVSERRWTITRHNFDVQGTLSAVKCAACGAEWHTRANFVITLAALGRKPL